MARVLIVEDNPVLAQDLEYEVSAAGGTVVGMTATGAHAIESLEGLMPDIVFIDCNLRDGETGNLVADAADGAGCVCIFTTGLPDQIHDQFSSKWPVLEKPVTKTDISLLLQTVMADSDKGQHAEPVPAS